ncbi:MAG: SPOR domain-containing protein [Treponema sp.]|jgi:DedD protein|nr:SPOR domain-containing protein [Treponema sp.]
MEKRKLLLVAVSVGVFLVIVLSAAILIFTPTAGGAAVAAARPIPAGSTPAAQRGPASADATDMVRNAGDLQGLQAPPAGTAAGPTVASGDASGTSGTGTPSASAVQENNFYINGENPAQSYSVEHNADGDNTKVTINVPKPSAPTVPAPGTRPAASGNAGASTAVPASAVSAQSAAKSTSPAPAVAAKSTASGSAPKEAQGASQSTAAASNTAAPRTASPAAATASRSAPAASPRTTPSRAQNDYWIQTGAFSALVRAEDVKETLASKGLSSIIDDRDVEGQTWYRVRVGPYTSENEANYWLALVRAIDGFNESQVRSTAR